MTSIGRHLLAAPARRLLSEAGPPTSWVLVSFIVATALGGILFVQPGVDALVAVLVALVVLTIPSVLDVDGWRIRLGMAWLAAQQRRRMSDMPRTPAGADRWLARTGDDAPALDRASMLLMAGRPTEARALVETTPRDDPEDRARIARMLAVIDGFAAGSVDPSETLAAIEALRPDLRRYHLISLAWSTAWVAAMNRRPWRHAFAVASCGVGPKEIPARAVLWSVTQELLAPLTLVAFLLIGRALGAW